MKGKELRGGVFVCSLAAGQTANHVHPQQAVEGLDQTLLEQTLAKAKKGPLPLLGFLEHICLASEVIFATLPIIKASQKQNPGDVEEVVLSLRASL